MNKLAFSRLPVCVLICAALLVVTAGSYAEAAVKRYDVPEEGSPVIGPQKADITIIKFVDYQ